MATKVDATSLAVGLEDGSIELWERVGKKMYKLFLSIFDKVCTYFPY